MEKLVTVKLINGKTISVLPRELEELEAQGKLLKERIKEYKSEADEITKDRAQTLSPEQQKEANERMKPSKKGPVNISSQSIKGGRPKKA